MMTIKQPSSCEENVKGKSNTPFFPKHLVQTKLQVNEPGDNYEREADAMADHVMRMGNHSATQRSFFKPAVGSIQRKCQHCEEEEKLHRKESSDGEVQSNDHLDNYVSTLGSSGQRLSETSRAFFEPRFGQDFSDVRIHNDSVAAKSAQSINALAYTTGNNIVFNEGQYSPDSESGKRLMAHELTHVVQQSNNVLPKLIQRDDGDGPVLTDPSAHDPFYVQPGGPFDMGDNIFHLQIGPDGVKLDFPAPGAAPGADNLGFTLFCPTGQTHVFHSGDCCPVGRYNQATDTCCDEGQVPGGSGGCVDPSALSALPLPIQPPIPTQIPCDVSQYNLVTQQCCPPPTIPYLGNCVSPAAIPRPTPPQGISGTISAGVIDDYDIDAIGLNGRQTSAYQNVLSTLRLTLHNCPATTITITGFTDAPGTAEHNANLAQNRADSLKMRLQLDLFDPTSQIQPFIVTLGEGSDNPVDTSAGQGYSARNRRVEVEMAVQCPPLTL